MPRNTELTQALNSKLSIEIGQAEIRAFPDDESYIRINSDVINNRNVSVSMPDIKNINHIPILVDDIISTGVNMLESLRQLILQGFKNPICIGVHALFNVKTENKLRHIGAEQIITCNTIPRSTNKIDISDIIAKGIVELC